MGAAAHADGDRGGCAGQRVRECMLTEVGLVGVINPARKREGSAFFCLHSSVV